MKDAVYRQYLLGLLVLIGGFNFVDRLLLGLVQQSIKVDLHLTDTELGLMSGFAVSVFYAFVGIPLARWADTGNRVTLIAVTTVMWSVFMALCGGVRNFVQLLLVRIAVGVGHAGSIPTASSLLPEYFSRAERPRVMGISELAAVLGLAIGYGAGGWIAQVYGWRAAFVILSLPGLVLAAVAALTLREPRKALAASAAPQKQSDGLGLAATIRAFATLSRNATFRHLVLCVTVSSFFSDGIYLWLPSFFVRSYGMTYGALGTWLAASNVISGLVACYLGGDLMSRFAGHSERLQFKIMAVIAAMNAVFTAATFLSPNQYVAFGFQAVNALLQAGCAGTALAAAQTIVPDRMRATAFAVIYLFTNLVGGGLGPLIGGALSDALHPAFGEESLRYALVALSPGFLWSAMHMWWARRTVERDIAAAQLDREGQAAGDAAAVMPLN